MPKKQELYVSIRDLAEKFNIDRSNVRKFVLNQGFSFIKTRTPYSKGQLTSVLSIEDAKAVTEIRELHGFSTKGKEGIPYDNHKGYFYVIQLIPEIMPNRIKLGFAANAEHRLNAHRTSAPTATLLKSWLCDKAWEKTAMASITRVECRNISSEVFECDNLDNMVKRAEMFFKIMP